MTSPTDDTTAIDSFGRTTENKPNQSDMKSITQLSFIATTVVVIATGAAFADDPQLQNRLAMQQARLAESRQTTTTIGVYAGDRGVGRRAAREMRENTGSECRYEVRSNPHGQSYGIYVPAR